MPQSPRQIPKTANRLKVVSMLMSVTVRLICAKDAKQADQRSDDAVDCDPVHSLASAIVMMREIARNSNPHQIPDVSF